MGVVYLHRLDEPYQHARHYLGRTGHIERRLAARAAQAGSPLMAACARAGIGWTLARTWEPADRRFERQLKRWHGSAQRCPLSAAQQTRADRQAPQNAACGR
jgi:hypothetical protein